MAAADDKPLAGKTALVTGASRGIGLATTRALLARGARVAMLARNGARLEEAAAEFAGTVITLQADLTEPASLKAAFAKVAETTGLDILVNNAGISGLSTIEALDDDGLRAEVMTNFVGTVACCREAIPLLRRAGGGDIINVSSSAVADPYPYMSIYAATKAAVESFSVVLRRELETDGIRVTVFRPGPTWTNFNEGWDPVLQDEALRVWAEKGYAGINGAMEPETVGEAIASVATLPAGASMEFFELHPTGQTGEPPAVRK